MSFLKKLTAEFKELMNDKDEKSGSKKNGHEQPLKNHEANRDFSTHVQQPFDTQPSQAYVGLPPGQPLPLGWMQQWDPTSQRWYYVEQATGRSQWEPPLSYGAPPPVHGFQPYGQPQQYSTENKDIATQLDTKKKKEKGSKAGLIAAGAGGVAVGALAGAALAGDSSDEEQSHTYPSQPVYYSGTTTTVPAPLENNPELSSSQRSSLEDARKDYEEAQREVANDSSPDSSDIEELEEAREEYHSEIEEAEEELED